MILFYSFEIWFDLILNLDISSFETWFDVEAISDEAADEAIIEEERKKNILGMLHQVCIVL